MALTIEAHKDHATVIKYAGYNRYVVIPETYQGLPVTKIEEGVFRYNPHLKGVFIPKTLKSIGMGAFEHCLNLQYIGCGLETEAYRDIPSLPEDKHPNLKTLPPDNLPVLSVLPESTHSVGTRAFVGTALKRIKLQAPYVFIGNSAFEYCTELELVALYSCQNLILGKQAFMHSAITRFYAPQAEFSALSDYAFAHCSNLTSVQVPIRSIGERCFYQCDKLNRLSAPEVVDRIGKEAFAGCKQLKDIPRSAETADQPASPTAAPVPDEDNLDEPDFGLDVLSGEPLPPVNKEPEKDTPCEKPLPERITKSKADVLFHLQIDYRGKMRKHIPGQIKGTFTKAGNTYFFQVETPSALGAFCFQCVSDRDLASITPILNHLVKNSTSVSLLGTQDENYYSVAEILPSPPDTRSKPSAISFFRNIITRLKKPIPKGVDVGSMMPPSMMRESKEFETFVSICQDHLPAWVVNAYYRNKDISQRISSTSSDERKHAMHAQELLLNIDWLPNVTNIPPTEEVEAMLDKFFYGLYEVKERITEVIAQIHRSGTLPKWGILLHGPAGTGKTTIAKAIANVMRMPLIQIDISTVGTDRETISGSARIFSNASPGSLLKGMYTYQSSTAILLANEIDKVAGEARDTLLTILDKTGFYENFLEEVVPTDNLFCIATCNDLSTISKPLLDRFQIIEIPAYTPDEKKIIWNKFSLPMAMEARNVSTENMALTDEATDVLISEYALELGARDLEQYAQRFVGNYCRYAAKSKNASTKRIYTVEDVRSLLGPGQKVVRKIAIHPGEVNAAFYHGGRAHFFLMEAVVIPGSGKFETIGPMGPMQTNYCKAAYWCVRSTTNCDLSQYDVAVFVPQPIPEGLENHVGLACYAAICSKLLNANLALRDICFVGGCDMNGSLYFDENDLTPLLRAMKSQGVSTLYAPIGTNRLVDAKTNADCNVTIVEAPDAKTLFSLAVTRNSLQHG